MTDKSEKKPAALPHAAPRRGARNDDPSPSEPKPRAPAPKDDAPPEAGKGEDGPPGHGVYGGRRANVQASRDQTSRQPRPRRALASGRDLSASIRRHFAEPLDEDRELAGDVPIDPYCSLTYDGSTR